jgi:hypothetical protein
VLLTVPNCVLVAGDDSLAKFTKRTGEALIIEADFSMCDQSQDDGPLGRFMHIWMSALELPEVPIAIFQQCFSKGYRIKQKKTDVVISGNAGWQLATGSTATTIVNSFNDIAMYVYFYEQFLSSSDQNIDFSQLALNLGFTIKITLHSDVLHSTFLKGWFVPVSNYLYSHMWTPLPSAVCKLGKIMKTPQSIGTMSEIAYMISRSYQHVPRNLPILGPFLSIFDRLSTKTDKFSSLVIENFEYKPQMNVEEPVLINIKAVFDMIEKRYKFDPHDVQELEKLYNSISSLPVIYHHDLVFELRNVDYC